MKNTRFVALGIGVIAIIAIGFLVYTGKLLLRSPNIPDVAGQPALLKSFELKDGVYYASLDYVSWLTGQAAIDAAVADGACVTPDYDSCAPDGYYVDNPDTTVVTIEVAASAKAAILEGSSLIPATLAGFAHGERLSPLVSVDVSGGKVTSISELYTP